MSRLSDLAPPFFDPYAGARGGPTATVLAGRDAGLALTMPIDLVSTRSERAAERTPIFSATQAFVVVADTSGHGLPNGAVVRRIDDVAWTDTDCYTQGGVDDEVAIDPADLRPAEPGEA